MTPIDAHRTRLQFVHHLDDQANPTEVGPGWEFYLDRLLASQQGTAMPEWDDYWPSLAAAYAEPT